MTDKLETAEVQTITKPVTPRAIVLADALREDTEQRKILGKYVKEHMIPGTDFGVIPGTKLPTLLKPGAEKLLDLFRCRPEYELLSTTVDRDEGLYEYVFRCKAVSRETDTVLNEGVGMCSSYESKYRYRTSKAKCPKCGAETIIRSKFPPRGSPKGTPGAWWCAPRDGGCGSEFQHDDPTVTAQPRGKVQNHDLADVANTVLKMAKKRAQVDCAIALARVSDMFTQDVEDTHPGAEEPEPPPAQPSAPPPDNTERAAQAVVEQVQEQAALQADAMALMTPKARARRDALWLRLVGSGQGQLGMTATKAAFWMTKSLKSLKPIKSIDDLTDEQLTKLEEAFSHEFGD